MAKKSTFLLMNLKEDRTKKLAQAIQNEKCRKMLDALAEREYTESDLAENLSIPISTVHYNLKLLVDANLVNADEYHYSKKGKEVLHYSLANKFVIIAPKEAPAGFMDKLKTILPVAVMIAGASLVIGFFNKFGAKAGSIMSETAAAPLMKSTAIEEGARVMADAAVAEESAAELLTAQAPEAVNQTAPQVVEKIIYVPQESNLIFWFVAGAVFCLVLYLIVEYIRRRSRN